MAVQEQMSWAVEHRNLITAVLVVVGVIVLAVAGGWFYLQKQNDKASVALSAALRTSDAPLRPPATPANPNVVSFTSVKERAAAAEKEFRAVADQYPHTRSAEFARYWVGVTAMEQGDYKTAEQELQPLTHSSRDQLAPLAKFALASVYRGEGKQPQAIELYKDLIEHPSTTVPKSTAQMELAALYEGTQPAEAAKIYEQIRKDDPKSAAAQLAGERLQGARPQP